MRGVTVDQRHHQMAVALNRIPTNANWEWRKIVGAALCPFYFMRKARRVPVKLPSLQRRHCFSSFADLQWLPVFVTAEPWLKLPPLCPRSILEHSVQPKRIKRMGAFQNCVCKNSDSLARLIFYIDFFFFMIKKT